MKKYFSLLILPLMFQTNQALAWGVDGHKIIAAIAWDYLTPAAKKQVIEILGQDKDTLTANNFVDIAPWADAYRDNARPDGAAYIGTREWHFVDTPLATTDEDSDISHAIDKICPSVKIAGVASVGAPAHDCVTNKIVQFAHELQDTSTSSEERIFALKFIVHFVGDVHQPFHAIDNNDKGGNCVWVATHENGKPLPLHAFWDSVTVKQLENQATPREYAHKLSKKIEKMDYMPWASGYAKDWATESFKIGKETAYGTLGVDPMPNCDTENKTSPILLSKEYQNNADEIAQSQLEKGGIRLAAVLNGVLK